MFKLTMEGEVMSKLTVDDGGGIFELTVDKVMGISELVAEGMRISELTLVEGCPN